MKYYFTLGQNHVHTIDDALGGFTYDKDVVVEIEAENSNAARSIMFETFGRKWSNQYSECPDMRFFPRGVKVLL